MVRQLGNFYSGTDAGGNNLVVTDGTVTNWDVEKIIVSAGTITASSGKSVTITTGGGGGGSIGGTIATTQVAYGTAADTIGGEAAFTYTAGTNTLTVDNIDSSGGTVTANVLTDGTAQMSSGTVTDGTAQMSGGSVTTTVPGTAFQALEGQSQFGRYIITTTPLDIEDLSNDTNRVGGITYFNGGVTELSLGDLANGGQDLSNPLAVGRVWRVWNGQVNPINIFLSAASFAAPLPTTPTLTSIFVEGTGTSANGVTIPAWGTAEIVVLAAGTAGASGNSLVAL